MRQMTWSVADLEPTLRIAPGADQSKQNPFLHNSEPDYVGFAVIGLTAHCLSTILPAFEWCENARLKAVVSGNLGCAERVARDNDIPRHSVYSFHDFDRIKNNREVQVVYISLSGALRDEMIARAARAGKHVICEGRFSSDTKVDRAVAQVCDEAGVKLIMTYREPGKADMPMALQLDHMANCVLRDRAPLSLVDALRSLDLPRIDVARWAN